MTWKPHIESKAKGEDYFAFASDNCRFQILCEVGCKWTVACEVCGKEYTKYRTLIARHIRAFCSQSCYHSLRQDGRYKQWRQGQRTARKVVSRYFPLTSENIVHHEDRDNGNNSLPNLRVFATQADHMAYHHGITTVVPLWDGRSVQP